MGMDKQISSHGESTLAPNVFPIAFSHTPASSCIRPPQPQANGLKILSWRRCLFGCGPETQRMRRVQMLPGRAVRDLRHCFLARFHLGAILEIKISCRRNACWSASGHSELLLRHDSPSFENVCEGIFVIAQAGGIIVGWRHCVDPSGSSRECR